MNNIKRLLFTAGGSPSSVSIYHSLKTKSYELFFVDSKLSRIDPEIPGEVKFEVPNVSCSLYLEHVKKLVEEHSVDILVPGIDEELVKVHKSFAQSLCVFSPSLKFIEICLDKLTLGRKLKEHGLPEPDTALLGLGESKFNQKQYVIKPRYGRGSRNIYFGNEHLVNALAGGVPDPSDWVTQSAIVGSEFTVQVIASQKGVLKKVIPLKVNLKRGSTVSAEIVNDPLVIDYVSAIHNRLRGNGTYNIQLIKSIEGLFCFEINPRISTTFCVAFLCGINPFEEYLDDSPPDTIRVAEGLRIERYWQNYFLNGR